MEIKLLLSSIDSQQIITIIISQLGHKESAKPRPLGQKNRAKNHPLGNYFQISSKKQQNMNETEIMKNSTKMLTCLKHLKAQSFLVGGFYGYSKYLKSFSIHLQTNTRNSWQASTKIRL